MIRHNPFGSGHPYSIDTDQRSPVDPIEGENLTLGVRSTQDVREVFIEWCLDGVSQSPIALQPTNRKSRGESLDGGHLASAQARLAKRVGGWTVILKGLKQGQKLSYRFVSNSGNTSWFETSVFAWKDFHGVQPTIGRSRLIPGVRVLTDGVAVRKVNIGMTLEEGERVTGFGERFEGTEFRGSEVSSILFEQYKNQGRESKTYLPMAFAHILGGDGWGFWVESFRKVCFDIGMTQRDRLDVTIDVDGTLESSFSPIIRFFDGSPQSVLGAFLEAAGRPQELPDWVFGLWASGNEWNTQAEVLRQADLHLTYDIPFSNLVIEAWSDESTFTRWRDSRLKDENLKDSPRLEDFEFDPSGAWPDPKGMVDDLHGRGVKVHLWQIPLLKMRPHPAGPLKKDVKEAIEMGHLIQEPGKGNKPRPYRNRGWWFPLALMPDLTDPDAAKWWTEKRRYLVRDMGIDGFKTDGGEHAWGRELIYKNGLRGDEMNWRFPVHYAKAYGDLLASEGKAPVTFSRAGNVGSQAHGAFWAGDENSNWDAFRWSLNAGLTAASSGIFYWGWDFAGFSGELPTPELYLRSTSTAVFVPIMQYHSEYNHHRSPSRDRTPWNVAEYWGRPGLIDDFRALAKLRQRLIPYLSSEMKKGMARSTPLMRPLFFDFDDPEVWSRDSEHQWMLGDSILVAPDAYEGSISRSLWLPSGRDWVDPLDGRIHQGGQYIVRQCSPNQPPVLVEKSSWEDRLQDIFIA